MFGHTYPSPIVDIQWAKSQPIGVSSGSSLRLGSYASRHQFLTNHSAKWYPETYGPGWSSLLSNATPSVIVRPLTMIESLPNDALSPLRSHPSDPSVPRRTLAVLARALLPFLQYPFASLVVSTQPIPVVVATVSPEFGLVDLTFLIDRPSILG